MATSTRTFSADDEKWEKIKDFLEETFPGLNESPTKIINAAFDYIIRAENLKDRVKEHGD